MEVSVLIQNKAGLHARPASMFVQTASKFSSSVTLVKNDREANGKSILGVMSLGISGGDTIVIRAEGADAQAALEALKKLVDQKFGEE